MEKLCDKNYLKQMLSYPKKVSLPPGFPRQTGTWIEIGGVRSAFSMPEVVSIALGGGTKVEEKNGVVTVGPESVGHQSITEGLVFGSETLTATGITRPASVFLENLSR